MKAEKRQQGMNPLENVKAVGLLLIEAITTNASDLWAHKREGSRSYRKSFKVRVHNAWVRLTTTEDERREAEDTLDAATIGDIRLTEAEYYTLNKRTFW